MNNPSLPPENLLEAQVQRYHKQRLKRWYTFLLPSVSVLILALGTLHGVIWYRAHQASKLQLILEAQHKTLAQKWSSFQKSAKHLKALTQELSLLQHNKLPHYLTALSEAIPSHTLITSLEFEAPHALKITGYANTMEELSLFMLNLSTQKGIEVSLNRSYQGAPGVYFEMVEKDQTRKKAHGTTP